MFTDSELAHLKGMGFERDKPVTERRASLQDVMAHRRYTDLDYDRSFLLFIERARYRVGDIGASYLVAEFDVRLMYPWPWQEDGRPHPGMCQMEAGAELGRLLSFPYNRRTHHIILDVEPYTLIDRLIAYLERPDLRVAFGVAYAS